MKKLTVGLLIAAMTVCIAAPTHAAEKGRGGPMGFIAGCCFGVRAAGDYNDGKELGPRDWLRLIPFVSIWDGIEGAQGMTTAHYTETYGSIYY